MTKVIVVAAGLLLTMGCMHSDPEKAAAYEPVPDDELFSQIGDVEGVTAVDVKFSKSLTQGTGYSGEITVDDTADATATLDHAYAILRQGRPKVNITVFVRQGNKQLSSSEFGMAAGTPPNLEKRYGEQPGDGTPPAS